MRAALLLYMVAMPPPEFDKPYTGRLEIQYAAPHEITALCGGGKQVHACAFVGDGWCRIIFPEDVGTYPQKKLELLMRHEIAHCNGWEH